MSVATLVVVDRANEAVQGACGTGCGCGCGESLPLVAVVGFSAAAPIERSRFADKTPVIIKQIKIAGECFIFAGGPKTMSIAAAGYFKKAGTGYSRQRQHQETEDSTQLAPMVPKARPLSRVSGARVAPRCHSGDTPAPAFSRYPPNRRLDYQIWIALRIKILKQ